MSTPSLPLWLLRPATLVFLGVITGCSMLVPMVLESGDEAQAVESAVAPAASASTPVRSARTQVRARCETCGVVESITRLEPSGNGPDSYEFTVRLRDGSARVSSVSGPSAWRVGDSIMLMGGGTPAM
jgi:hypothetical protein